MHSSSCIWMSPPSSAWISIDRSGVSRWLGAVDVRLEGGALLGDLADRGEAHDLEAARVGEDRAAPAHEGVQAAEARDALGAGPQHQVVGVAEHDVRPGRRAPASGPIHRLHRAGGADRHEGGRANDAAGCCDLAETRRPVLGDEAVGEGGHSGRSKRRRSIGPLLSPNADREKAFLGRQGRPILQVNPVILDDELRLFSAMRDPA